MKDIDFRTARVLSIMASDRRWSLDEVVEAVAGKGHNARVRQRAFQAIACAVCDGMTSTEIRAEAEARIRSKR